MKQAVGPLAEPVCAESDVYSDEVAGVYSDEPARVL